MKIFKKCFIIKSNKVKIGEMSMAKWEDYYAIMELSPDATPLMIAEAREKMDRRYHVGNTASRMERDKAKQVIKAYSVLNNPHAREKYDKTWEKMKNKVSSANEKTAQKKGEDAGAGQAQLVSRDKSRKFDDDDDPTLRIKQKSFKAIKRTAIFIWVWLGIMAWLFTIRKLGWLLVINIGFVIAWFNQFKKNVAQWKAVGWNTRTPWIISICVVLAALLFGTFLNDIIYNVLTSLGIFTG